MGTPTYDEHFLLKNFTDEEHCHICGLLFTPSDDIWEVEGLIVYDVHAKSTKPSAFVYMHTKCCMSGAPS